MPTMFTGIRVVEAATDPRFATAAARRATTAECAELVAAAVANAPLAEWRSRLTGAGFPWEVHQTPTEVLDDVQVTAGDLAPAVDREAGGTVRLIRAPVRFDGAVDVLRPAPRPGERTDEILDELDPR